MTPPKLLPLGAALLIFTASSASAFIISFSSADFGKTPVFSSVTTFAFDFDVASSFSTGLYADPSLNDIQYSVSGSLAATPSMFPSFGFALHHKFPGSPPGPITGTEFYALDMGTITAGETFRFEISGSADLSDGLQVSELVDLGGGVVFRFNGHEEGTGRYHPAFLELRSNGTGTIQNSDNHGGINPSSMELVDLGFGDEYITNLTFDASTFTIGVPEPSRLLLTLLGLGAILLRRRW